MTEWFEQLYADKNFHTFILSHLYTSDKELISDMTQDLYLLLFEVVKPSKFQTYKQFKNFCAMVVRNSLSKTGNITRWYVAHMDYLGKRPEKNTNKYVEYEGKDSDDSSR